MAPVCVKDLRAPTDVEWSSIDGSCNFSTSTSDVVEDETQYPRKQIGSLVLTDH